MHCGSKVRYFHRELNGIYFYFPRAVVNVLLQTCIFSQGDHLTTAAWAACGPLDVVSILKGEIVSLSLKWVKELNAKNRSSVPFSYLSSQCYITKIYRFLHGKCWPYDIYARVCFPKTNEGGFASEWVKRNSLMEFDRISWNDTKYWM